MVVERVEEWVYERESSGTGGDEGRREASLRKWESKSRMGKMRGRRDG